MFQLRTQPDELIRERYLIEERHHNDILIDGKPLINFCSNDYLNIADHPRVKQAFIVGVKKFGLGSGASAIVSGYTKPHALLEKKMAEWLKRDRAIFFNSGYHANLGVMTTFADRHSIIVADKLCHASLIDAFILARSQLRRYNHHDTHQANQILQQSTQQNKFLVSESIFSMEGDITDIKTLSHIATTNHAMFIVDDAHGLGVLGKEGRGIVEHFSLTQKEVPCLITPFGKALGSMGAVVSGSEEIIETLVQFARTYRYSTALPPAICDASLQAIDLIQQETWRRDKLNSLITFFNEEAKKRGFDLMTDDQTPIRSIRIGSNRLTLKLQKKCFTAGYFISCIRPPTVPINTARIRISLTAKHTKKQIIALLTELEKNYTYAN